MTNSVSGLDGAQELLIKLVEQNPDDWEIRKKVVMVLYDANFYRDASKMVWSAPEIPPVGEEVIFAAKIVSRGQPGRAMRLFDTVIEKNMSHPEENLAMAKLLVKASMPHQAIRFYGAATVMDTKLIDENFELSLIGADAEGKNWSELVSTDDFPWEGPKVPAVDTEAETKQADPYAELLNGATQPVPMKAPVREKVERRDELPNWKIENKKTSYLSKEMLEEESAKNEPEVKPVELVIAEPKEVPPVAAAVVPQEEVESAPVERVAVEQEESKPAGNVSGAFFKSYDDAHERTQETASEVNTGAPAVPRVSRITEPVQVSEAKESSDDQASATLAEHVSDAMSQTDEPDAAEEDQPDNQQGQIKARMSGAFSSLMQKMRRKSAENVRREPVINVDELDLSGIKAVPNNDNDLPVAAQEVSPVEVPKIREPMPMSPVSVAVKKPGPEEPSGPKELDGRTQLVSLAPEDGRCFFSQLREKYRSLQGDDLPRQATLARDMANIDYLDQINKACNKDLNAFSKLLGLHRVMSNAGCGEWVDDMNLLRKGYGDAVLATVVSRYSVTECREILNSVYSSPTAQAAV